MTFKNVMLPISHLTFHWYYVSTNYGNAINEFVILSKISIVIEFSFEIFVSCKFFFDLDIVTVYLFIFQQFFFEYQITTFIRSQVK